MKTILITGANGQLGREFMALAHRYPSNHFLFASRKELDLCSAENTEQFFHENQIDLCINCAAYTAVDKAETEVEDCMAVNVNGAGLLAEFCELQQIPMVHISTDYVYHGTQNLPYLESDIHNPQGVYAKTKYAGEHLVLEKNTRAIVIRTSWVYSIYGHNFVKTMLRLGTERPEINVVFDQIGSPTFAADLADAIMNIIAAIDSGLISWEEASGVYNYSNEGVASWFDFAKAIFEIKGVDCVVHPVRSDQFTTAAARPPFSLMDKTLIKNTFGLKIPYWRDSLKIMLNTQA